MKNGNVMKAVIFLMIILSLTVCLLACNDKNDEIKGAEILPSESEKEVTYTVTFDSCGGSEVKSVTTAVNKTIAEPTEPTRKGYEFIGWYKTESLFTQWDFDSYIVTSNMTLYAGWRLVNKVFIDSDAFDYTGGECYYNVTADTTDVVLTEKIVLEESNYRYAFYYDKACTEPVCATDTAVFTPEYGDNVYYIKIMTSGMEEVSVVKFTLKRNRIFTVTFYDGNGASLGTKTCEEGSVLDAPVDYVLTGYDVSWSDGTREWKFGENGTAVTDNVGLYAIAQVKTYKVTLDAAGGTVSESVKNITFGENAVLGSPVKQGAGFIGWYTTDGTKVTGSNGIGLFAWNIPYDVTLVAKWDSNAEDFIIVTELSGKEYSREQKTIAHGESAYLSASEDFSEIVKTDDNKYIIYAFGGWYSGNLLLSNSRQYTTAPVNSRTEITEKWYELVIGGKDKDSDEAVDQELKISGSENLTKYGNINAGETLKIESDCKCGKHTFYGWDDGSYGESVYVTVNATKEINSLWESLTVGIRIYLDGQITENYDLISAITGLGLAREGTEVKLSANPFDEYTFLGWFTEDEKISGGFGCDFEMPGSSLVIDAKWYTTSELYKIVSEDESKGKIEVRVKAENNIAGGEVSLVPDIKTGYILDGLYDEEGQKADSVSSSDLIRNLPEEPTELIAKFKTNNIKIESNIINAGDLTYKVNEGRKTIGTTYGGEVKFGGMLDGDELSLSAGTYDGYVWIGWYKEDTFLTSSANITLGKINAQEAEDGINYTACWKPASYNVNITAGVYVASSPTYITANKYYTYSDGLYILSPSGQPVAGTNYYTFSDDTYTGGTQKAIASTDAYLPGENITLRADVSNGYRFEGWYDEDGNLLTFDLEYEFNVKDLKSEYKAWYTYLGTNYDVAIGIFEGTPDEPAVTTASGGINYYAYKKISAEDILTEICVVNVKTKKEAVTVNAAGENDYRGYNYLGLYNGTTVSLTWNSLRNPLEPVSEFNGDDFSYTYEIDVTALRQSSSEKQTYYAVWRKSTTGDFYVTADIYNSNNNAGNIYYIAYNGLIVLVAEPNNGYLFKGWTDENGTTVTNYVYSTGNNGRGKIYTANWQSLNSDVNERQISILGGATREEGGFFVTGTQSSIGDNIILEAYTNNGYTFLGWYAGGEFLTANLRLEIMRKKEAVDGIETEVLVYYDEGGNEVCKIESNTFEPKWKKHDAEVIVDSIGSVSVTGFWAEDENGILKSWYRLKVLSEIEYGIYGAAWYEGYFFDGWYDKEGNLLGTGYELIVEAGRLESYYKTVWSKINVEVEITTNGEQRGGSTATYAFYHDGTNLYLILNAKPASGYSFAGWNLEQSDGFAVQSYSLQYTVNLGEFDREKTSGRFVYSALFGEINPQYLPNAKTSDMVSTLESPEIVGYLSGNINAYRVTAKDINGYVFEGWKEKDSTTGEYISDERTFTYTTEYIGLTAIYRSLSSVEGYENIYVTTEKKYEDKVKNYGYYKDGELIVEIFTEVPEGYLYRITDESGTVFPAEKDNYRITHISGESVNGILTVEFGSVSEYNSGYTETEQEIDNVIFRYSGKYEKEKGVAGAGDRYAEKWELSAAFGEEGYSFIGWYDEDGILLDIYDTYEIPACGKDTVLNLQFGKYEIQIINSDNDAGSVYVDGYGINVEFDLNTDDEELKKLFPGGIPSQELNAGDKLVYPTQILDKATVGYMFGGWYETPDATGEEFDFNSSLKRDIKLYAKWIALSDYGAGEDNIIYADGKERTFVLQSTEEKYYFTAAVSGIYKLTFKNTSDTTNVSIRYGEALPGGGYVNEETLNITGTNEKTAEIEAISGKSYCVGFTATKGEGKPALVRLERPEIKIEGKRDAKVPYGGSVSVIAIPRETGDNETTGYAFYGWYTSDGTLITDVRVVENASGKFSVYSETSEISYEDYAKYANEDGVIELTAIWKKYQIEIISSDLDGGSTGVTMSVVEGDPSYEENAGARQWVLGAIARNGYSFGGWYLYDIEKETFEEEPFSTDEALNYVLYDGDEKLIIKAQWVYGTQTGRYTITYTMNTADAVNSPYNVSEFNSNSTTTIILYDPHKYYKESDGTVSGYYIFEGWYTDREFKNRITEINPKEMQWNITLYAKWGNPVKNIEIYTDTDGSRYFYLGVYPQTKVTSTAFITSLRIDNGAYTDYDYRKKYNYYDPLTGDRYYRVSDTLAYKCDAIRWNIISGGNGKVYAISDIVLDIVKFNTTTNTIDGIYANSWASSKIRSWLNNEFYLYHFTEIEKNFLNLALGSIVNNETTGHPSYRDTIKYPWAKQENISDVMFAASYSDMVNAEYGFGGNVARIAGYSDYVSDKFSQSTATKGYWLRSWGETSSKAFAVNENGELIRISVDSECGVRPLLQIDLGYIKNE